MKRLFFAFFVLAIAGLGLFWWLTRPVLAVSGAQAAALEQGGDAGRGELVFHGGGCASCHATPGQPDRTRQLPASFRAFPPRSVTLLTYESKP